GESPVAGDRYHQDARDAAGRVGRDAVASRGREPRRRHRRSRARADSGGAQHLERQYLSSRPSARTHAQGALPETPPSGARRTSRSWIVSTHTLYTVTLIIGYHVSVCTKFI